MKSRRGPYTGIKVSEFFDMGEALFTPQEAGVNNAMTGKPFTAAAIVAEMNSNEEEIRAVLVTMADKGESKMTFPVTRVNTNEALDWKAPANGAIEP